MLLGAHESIAGGVFKAFERAAADTAEAVQIFTKNARGWAAKPLAPEEAQAFRDAQKAAGIPAVAHCTYLVNLGSEDPDIRSKSLAAFADELQRCSALGIPWLVVHPGAHPNPERGIEVIASGLDECFAAAANAKTGVALEITAGQGTSVGHRFEHLAGIIERSRHASRLGVCLDTCHLFAAGYDIASPAGYEATMRDFDRIVGVDRIKVFHLNDCKKPLGCRVDRHEEIGLGEIGLEGFRPLLTDPRFAQVPGVLETPEFEKYAENLARLRSLVGGPAAQKPAVAAAKKPAPSAAKKAPAAQKAPAAKPKPARARKAHS